VGGVLPALPAAFKVKVMREFETGATRNDDEGRLDFEGFLSVLAVERFAEYMNSHRIQADGKMRDSDNWQKGMPRSAYIKSMFRHFFEVWKIHRGYKPKDGIEEALCALMFNVQGYLHETIKERNNENILLRPSEG